MGPGGEGEGEGGGAREGGKGVRQGKHKLVWQRACLPSLSERNTVVGGSVWGGEGEKGPGGGGGGGMRTRGSYLHL